MFAISLLSAHTPAKPIGLRLVALEARIAPATVQAADDLDDYDASKPKEWAGKNGTLSLPEAIRQVNKEGGSIDFAVDQVTVSNQDLPSLTRKVSIIGKTGGNGTPGTTINGGNSRGGLVLGAGGSIKNLILQSFSGNAIEVSGGATTIENNYIGTDQSGMSASGTGNGGSGIAIYAAGCTVKNNVIGGNKRDGVGIDGSNVSGCKVTNNKIGVGLDGKTPMGNGDGVFIGSKASKNIVGGTDPADRNIIAANQGDGVLVELAKPGNQILGNYIGVDITGTTVQANAGNGVSIHGSQGTIVGGTSTAAANIIAGNMGAGVRIESMPFSFGVAKDNKVEGNSIGLDKAGNPKPNADGVVISDGATGNTIGGNGAKYRNIISGNTGRGVWVADPDTRDNKIQGNFIGTDATGKSAMPNGTGVLVASGAEGTLVGGTSANSRNLISGNTGPGVEIIFRTTSATEVVGNYIGTDADGANALGNGDAGILIEGGTGTQIGGPSGRRNVISGNGTQANAAGISVTGGNLLNIENNYIGINATGSASLPNAAAGVDISGGENAFVGDGSPATRNVISGNDGPGILVHDGPGGKVGVTVVHGNYIGTDPAGDKSIGNTVGISVQDTAYVLIGGVSKNTGNLISGNNGNGVYLNTSSGVDNKVGCQLWLNYIGTDRTGKGPLGNGGNGVEIKNSTYHEIGDPSGKVANIIAFNGNDGVFVNVGGGNSVLSNLIFSNGNKAIESLGASGVRPDTPTITSAKFAGGFITITGKVANRGSQDLRIELFGNAANGNDGGGQGTVFLGDVSPVTTAADGTFTVKFKRSVPGAFAKLAITATDKDTDGSELSTSEFSTTFNV
jgi:Right handed beta helix region